MRTGTRTWLCLATLLLVTAPRAAQDHAPERASINEADLRSDVSFLSSDAMAGRLANTDGNRLAVEFVRSRFEHLDLGRVASDGYLMGFELIVPALGPDHANTLAVDDGEADHTHVVLGRDYYPERMSGAGQASGPVVFAGFGISAPALDHDDFGEVNITGKVVLMLNHEPGEYDAASRFDGVATSEYARDARKVLEAQRRGAVAVLFVTDVHNHDVGLTLGSSMGGAWPTEPERIPQYELAAWVDRITIPVARISPELAGRLVGGAGAAFDTLSADAEAASFDAVEVDHRISVSTEVARRRIATHNVVGVLEGDDPALRDEWVIIGAHLDHEGVNGARVFNGADDNASGVAGMLEIAEAYAKAARAGDRPRRSVLFGAWNAEERGLLGAWAYTEQPLTPLVDTVAVLNLDMIGRDEEVPARAGRRFRGLPAQTAVSNRNAVNILGYSFSDDLRRAVDAANTVDLTVRFRYDRSMSNLVRRSDHWPFLARGVPALFVHTGLHPDYHTERDTAEKLNYEKMTRIVQLTHQLSWDLANADGRPVLD